MSSRINHPSYPRYIRILIGEPTVITMILVNAITLFLAAFKGLNQIVIAHVGYDLLHWIDYWIMVYFVLEALIKIRLWGFRGYWGNGWNKVDFIIVLAGLPLLLDPFINGNLEVYAVLPMLRLGRFLRFLRIMRFVPNAGHIGRGIVRSLKASLGVFIVLFGLNLMLAMGATMLFGEIAPQYFGNPFTALYSLFKIFTVEGWYEIPDALAELAREDPSRISPGFVTAVRFYIIVSVLVGGILGLSLANAVFVDEMTTDNTDEVEAMVTQLRREVQQLREELLERTDTIPATVATASKTAFAGTDAEQWALLQRTIGDLQRQLATLQPNDENMTQNTEPSTIHDGDSLQSKRVHK